MNGAVRMSLEDVSMLHFQEGVTTNLSAGNKGGNIYLDRVEFAEMSGHPIRLEASSDVKLNLEANGVVIVTTKEICRGVLISGQNVNANFNVFCSHKNPNIPGTPYVVLDGAKINLQEEHFSGFNNGAEVAGVK
jgi:hypothetical protein